MNASALCGTLSSCKYTKRCFYELDRVMSHSAFNGSQEDLMEYMSHYIRYILATVPLDAITTFVYTVSTLAGIIGSLLILVTMHRNEEFSAPCFLLYRLVCVMDIIYTAAKLPYIFNGLVCDWTSWISRSYWLTWMELVRESFGNIPLMSVHFISLFLCVERAVATLIPTKFYLFDRHWVHIVAGCVGVLIGFILCVPEYTVQVIVYKNSTETYYRYYGPSVNTAAFIQFGIIRTYFNFGQVLATIVASCLMVVGTLKVWWKRRTLLKHEASMDPDAVIHINKTLQICILQICLSTFIVIMVIFTQLVFLLPYTYTNGQLDIPAAYISTYIIFTSDISVAIAHGSDFYFYMAFSRTFRENFIKRFFQSGTTVSPITGNN